MKDYTKRKEVVYTILNGETITTCPYNSDIYVASEECFRCKYNGGTGGYLALNRLGKKQSVICNRRQISQV